MIDIELGRSHQDRPGIRLNLEHALLASGAYAAVELASPGPSRSWVVVTNREVRAGSFADDGRRRYDSLRLAFDHAHRAATRERLGLAGRERDALAAA